MIYIDTREKGHLRSAFDYLGIEYKVEQLKSGDYTDKKTFLCEYKGCDDFVKSVVDNRVFKQAGDLIINDYKVRTVYIGCRGLFDLCISAREKYMTVNNLIGAMTTIQQMGISVIYVDSPKTLALYIQSLASKANPELREHSPIRKKAKSGDYKLDILRGIPGVGPKSGKILLDRYESIKVISMLTLGELNNLNGINRKTAENIHKYLN